MNPELTQHIEKIDNAIERIEGKLPMLSEVGIFDAAMADLKAGWEGAKAVLSQPAAKPKAPKKK